MSEELRPCPFCGRQPYESGGYVSCHTELCLANADYHEPAIGSITDWNTRPIEDALESRIAELEALVNVSEDLYGRIYEQAARIAELEAEVTKCHELQDSYCDRIAESESTIERLIEAGKRLLDSLCTDPEEDKTDEVMNWKAVVDKVNKESEE